MKINHDAGSIKSNNNPTQAVDQNSRSEKHNSTKTNFSPAINEISRHLVPTAKALQGVSLKSITQNREPLLGTVSLDKLYRSIRQQKLLNTKTQKPLGEINPLVNSLFSTGRAGISLALGKPINQLAKSNMHLSEQVKFVNNDAPLEAQSGQFFSSLIVLNGDDQSFEGALFAPSDANAAGVSDAKAYVKQVGNRREMRNSASQISMEDGILIVRRTAGHMQLKKAGIENGFLGPTANNPDDKQVLWGGGFKINRAKDKDGRLRSWINVTYNSAHLNHRAPDGMVPEEIKPIFRQAMANVSGLPVYEPSQSPLNNDSAQATPENR
ncbi:MAG: hypothetical protein LW710_04510 [Burkholderiales bacterium]|jgi:hypothetical protein|uniref:hypothetical protein n=1 Tax=Limnobacter sp. TaxID=2003368 RepID=UPI0039BCD405|nr:hypothetical protein [Burkholderiales bacterium]